MEWNRVRAGVLICCVLVAGGVVTGPVANAKPAPTPEGCAKIKENDTYQKFQECLTHVPTAAISVTKATRVNGKEVDVDVTYSCTNEYEKGTIEVYPKAPKVDPKSWFSGERAATTCDGSEHSVTIKTTLKSGPEMASGDMIAIQAVLAAYYDDNIKTVASFDDEVKLSD